MLFRSAAARVGGPAERGVAWEKELSVSSCAAEAKAMGEGAKAAQLARLLLGELGLGEGKERAPLLSGSKGAAAGLSTQRISSNEPRYLRGTYSMGDGLYSGLCLQRGLQRACLLITCSLLFHTAPTEMLLSNGRSLSGTQCLAAACHCISSRALP